MMGNPKNWIHFILWTTMLVYLVVAPKFYIRFVLKNGKPIIFTEDLPKSTNQIKNSVDRLDPVIKDGQEMSQLRGWALYLGDKDQSNYEKFIILRSKTRIYCFPTEHLYRPDLEPAFKDIDVDIDNAGFSTYISKDTIQPDSYRIGILFKHKQEGTLEYVITNKRIVVTPNHIDLILANTVTNGS
jgi:hypothetical protein